MPHASLRSADVREKASGLPVGEGGGRGHPSWFFRGRGGSRLHVISTGPFPWTLEPNCCPGQARGAGDVWSLHRGSGEGLRGTVGQSFSQMNVLPD